MPCFVYSTVEVWYVDTAKKGSDMQHKLMCKKRKNLRTKSRKSTQISASLRQETVERRHRCQNTGAAPGNPRGMAANAKTESPGMRAANENNTERRYRRDAISPLDISGEGTGNRELGTGTHRRRTPPSSDALRHSGGESLRCTSATVTLYLDVELSNDSRPGTEQKTSVGDAMPDMTTSLPPSGLRIPAVDGENRINKISQHFYPKRWASDGMVGKKKPLVCRETNHFSCMYT